MSREALIRPISWPLLPTPDDHGMFGFPSVDDSVRQMIRVILLTRPGEQLMHPDFGAGLARFMHEPNTIETRRRLRDVVVDALGRWESRIAVDDVEVTEIEGAPTQVRVEVFYQLRRTGQPSQLALTMTLGG